MHNAVKFTQLAGTLTPKLMTGDQGLPMKNFIPATLFFLWTAGPSLADQDPCSDYHRALAYSRTSDAAIATLMLREPKTGAEIELRLPRNFTSVYGNLSDGPQCKLAFELIWPQMTAGGLAQDNQKRVRDRMTGDVPAWRSLIIDVAVKRSPWAHWFVPSAYCHQRRSGTELTDRPYGLRAFDDGRAWPRHRQSDGSYRNIKELLPYPLNAANEFYLLAEDANEMIRISCSKGAPRCRLHDHFASFQTTTFFNAVEIANWKTYRDTVRQFLAAHTMRVTQPTTPVETGVHSSGQTPFGACMRELEPLVGSDTLRRMGLDQ